MVKRHRVSTPSRQYLCAGSHRDDGLTRKPSRPHIEKDDENAEGEWCGAEAPRERKVKWYKSGSLPSTLVCTWWPMVCCCAHVDGDLDPNTREQPRRREQSHTHKAKIKI